MRHRRDCGGERIASEVVDGGFVVPSFFAVLGVQPAIVSRLGHIACNLDIPKCDGERVVYGHK